VTRSAEVVDVDAQTEVSGSSQRVGAERPPATGLVKHLPNAITLARLAALPVFFFLYRRETPRPAWRSAILMFIAAWSDVLDGWVARRYNATSEFGRVLDPFADRLFFVVTFAAYLYNGTIRWWAALPVIGRDLLMVVGALFAFRKTSERPRVTSMGRNANFILAWAVGFFMLNIRIVGWPLYAVGSTLYVISGAQYFLRFLREQREGIDPTTTEAERKDPGTARET